MEAFSRLSMWFQRRQETKVMLLGASASGKTTLLYRWKLGRTVDTIPSIGFNVEAIVHRGRRFDIWDVAGWERIQNNATWYITPESVVFFAHDCTADEEQTEESITLLHDHIKGMIKKSAKNIWILFNKQDALPAEKQTDVIDLLRWRFTKELGNYSESDIEWRIMDQPGLSAKTGEQLTSVLDDVVQTLNSKPKRRSTSPKGLAPKPEEQVRNASSNVVLGGIYVPSASELQEQVQGYARNFRVDEDTFWNLFLKGDLENWGHIAYLHTAYKVLLDAFKRGDDIWEAAEDFLNHLQRLRQKDMFKECNTDNRTMAMFWLYHLNLAINRYTEDMRLSLVPSFAEFEQVLRHSPNLVYAKLWNAYYTEELLFSTESKVYWRLPDLKPLPPPVASTSRSTENPAIELVDDSERLIRYAFAVVKKYLVSDTARRGAIIRHALSALQSTTQRLRVKHISIPPYSETQAYFWIQLVHAAFVSTDAIYFDKSDKSPMTTRQLSYTGFLMLFDISPTAWKKYYSQTLWKSIEARVQFVNPDVASLPNVIQPESAGLTHLYLANAWERRLLNVTPELPSAEELAFYSSLVINSSERRDILFIQEHTRLGHDLFTADSDEHRDVLGMRPHALLLHYLYTAFISSRKLSKASGQTLEQHYCKFVDHIVHDGINSRTGASFWSLMVLNSASAVNEEDSFDSVTGFENLIRSNQHLAYEDLPLLYYSKKLWKSEEAKKTLVQPDRRKLDFSFMERWHDVKETSKKATETSDESKDWVMV